MDNNSAKPIALLLTLSFVAAALSACLGGCGHQWKDATCYEAKRCVLCGETEGGKLDHDWAEADCDQPKTCRLCSAIDGRALGHQWSNADCISPETCSVCNAVQGEKAPHQWTEADCDSPASCSVCNEVGESASGHDYEESILVAATGDKSGTKRFTCKNCGDSHDEEYSLDILSANEIYNRALECAGEITVTSEGFISTGTGFLISSDGVIVTNYHVIEDWLSIEIEINGVDYRSVKVLDYDADIDLAILKIDVTDMPYLSIADSKCAVGDTVYAFGSSRGLTATFSKGIVTYADRVMDGVTYVQHDAAISNGNSGGPLLNEFGEAVGINTLTVKDSQNLNFAISVSELDNMDTTP